MEKVLKIALLQIKPCGTLDENLLKGVSACREAKQQGADIALFPEMWSNGYNIYGRPLEEWTAEAIPSDGDFVISFGKLAKELDMAIGITLLEKYNHNPRNTLVLFDRFGERKLTYAKVHTCDFDVERSLTPGQDFYVCSLNTVWGDVQVGAMICYDREFPESARILMLKGAEVILVPNACPMEINRLSQLRARAFENMLGIATCNYPQGVPDCNGGSSVFDGVVYLPDVKGSRDTCILQCGEGEGVYVAELSLDRLRRYREKEVHGNAYRHPEKYEMLCKNEVAYPFGRKDRRLEGGGVGRSGKDTASCIAWPFSPQNRQRASSMYCILVTGVPAAGKSTMAEAVAERLKLPVISKDRIKELLFDSVGFRSRKEKVNLGIAAMEIMYYAAAQLMRAGLPFILENNFEYSSRSGMQALLDEYNYAALTLTLTGDYKAIYQRFLERESSPDRHRGHVVNDCYPEREERGTEERRNPHGETKAAGISYEDFVQGIERRGFDAFSVGGRQIKIDTTDFSKIDAENLFLQIEAWREEALHV